MQVHLLAQAAPPLAGVDELAGELEPEADVVGAPAPFPVAHAGHLAQHAVRLRRPRLVAVVACARLDRSLAASARDRVSDGRTCDGVDERRLPASCRRERRRGE